MLTVRSLIGPMLLERHLEDSVRADRRGEARCTRPRPPSRRSDAACAEAVMKRILPILLVAALAAAGFYWRAPLLSALGFGDEDGRYLGYVEGETSLIAPPVAGRLVERPVNRGDQVKKGDRLFVIDPVLAKAEVARTEGRTRRSAVALREPAQGQAAGGADVMRGQRREAEASLALAEFELKRQGQLLERGFTTRQNFDQTQSHVYQLRSRVASLDRSGEGWRTRGETRRDRRSQGAGRTGRGEPRPGEKAVRRPDAGCAGGRAGREHVLQRRRMGARRHAGRLAAAPVAA